MDKMRQHVEELTRLLEDKRLSSFNELQAVQRDLEAARAELETCRGAVTALENELADMEYNLVQARQKVNMLETYVVEDLVPPEEIIEQCYASQGLEYRRPSNEPQDEAEIELLKKEAADLRSQLTVANTLVIKLEEDRTKHLKKISDMTGLLKANKDSQKRLFAKSVECADLASERDLLQQQLAGLKDKNAALEAKLSETLGELEELQFADANRSMRETPASAENREEKERALTRIMETSIELAECRMKLDSVAEQLRQEQKRNQELAATLQDLDRSSNRGIHSRINTSLNLSNHSTSQRSSPHRLSLPPGILPTSSHGSGPEATIRRLQRRVTELEQQNEAYVVQVASLRAHNRMESVQE
jgi:chromosome segregation ATPase